MATLDAGMRDGGSEKAWSRQHRRRCCGATWLRSARPFFPDAAVASLLDPALSVEQAHAIVQRMAGPQRRLLRFLVYHWAVLAATARLDCQRQWLAFSHPHWCTLMTQWPLTMWSSLSLS